MGIRIKKRSTKLILRELEARIHKLERVYTEPSINREEISSKLMEFHDCGLNQIARERKIIISLTSYPARMYELHYTLYSLLCQKLKPDAVELWLAEEQFPNKESDIPRKILQLRDNGLTIRWCKEDWKSYKKLIPALILHPDDFIITADDDLYYPEDWLEKLWKAWENSSRNEVIAHRCHKIKMKKGMPTSYGSWTKCVEDCSSSFANFATCGAGALFAPGILHPDATNIRLARKLCPYADDVWFWAMAILSGKKTRIVEAPYRLIYTNPVRELNFTASNNTLYAYNGAGGNDLQLASILNHYPAILQCLQAATKR